MNRILPPSILKRALLLLLPRLTAVVSAPLLAALVLASFSVGSRAQLPIEWQSVLGGVENDYPTTLLTIGDGGYLVGGNSYSGMSGNKTVANFGSDSDVWLVRQEEDGTRKWEVVLGGTEDDFLGGVQSTLDGGYVLLSSSFSGVSGNKTSANFGRNDWWLVKLDANGIKQWEQVFGGAEIDVARTVRPTSDGGYILGGSSDSGISGNKTSENFGEVDCWIVKVDGAGNKEWERAFGGSGSDGLVEVLQTPDGGYLLGGVSSSPISGTKSAATQGGFDYWILKLDAHGDKQWDRVFGGDDDDELSSLHLTRDGGYILGGYSFSGVSGNKSTPGFGDNLCDFWLVKVAGSGAKQWEAVFGGVENNEFLNSVQPTPDGGYLLLGTAWSGASGNKTTANVGESDYWLVKVDSGGNKEWEQVIGGNDEDYPRVVTLTADGGYLLGGESESGATGNKTLPRFGSFDFWIVKLWPAVASAPVLTIQQSGNDAILEWPSASTGFNLEQSLALDPANWTSVNAPQSDDGRIKSVKVPLNSPNTYFRLRRP